MNTLLILEGSNDKSFYSSYKEHLKLSFEIEQMDGCDEESARRILKAIKTQHYTWIGFILDADNNSEEKKKRINKLAKEFELPISLFIIPSSGQGEMETDLLKILKDTHVKTCIDSFFSCLNIGFTKPDKAKHYTYLLAKSNYDGNCIKSKTRSNPEIYWDFDSEVLKELKNFLESSTHD